ncbi:MAG: peptide chain release factor N(5)-glutamine methyltransferase [Planctomycetia bacterium]|nr:peptide chain release factor N(5)-glutamine methyltransferase [Planctomycetia bacterium]
MANEDVWNVQRLLAWTTEFLKSHGSASPRLEAEILLADTLKATRIELYTRFDEVPTPEQLTKFRDYVRRRGAGEPVAYLVGVKEFYSLPFQVTSDVLIPRPETEQLVLESLDFLKRSGVSPDMFHVADLGTGSGNIAIAIARNAPAVHVTAVDVSEAALAIAKSNAERQGVAAQITFVKSDLFDALPDAGPFDVIVSNPPYITRAEYERLEPMVRDYEPELALCGGQSGTDVLLRIVAAAPEKLKPGGLLMLEASPATIDPVVACMKENPLWSDVRVSNDLARIKRYITAYKVSEH